MNWELILDALGGGASAVMIVFLALAVWNRNKRVDDLTDKFIEQGEKSITAMNELSRTVEKGTSQ